MLYEYQCEKCEHKYTRNNTVEHRHVGGRCPKCSSSNTKKIFSSNYMFQTTGGGHGGKIR